MQRLRHILAGIAVQLKDLTPASKALIGALVVILVLLMGYVVMFTAQPSLVPLGLSASTSDEVRAEVVAYLQDRNVTYRAMRSDIQVPADQKLAILGQLGRDKVIGMQDIDFGIVLQETSVFEDRTTKDRRYMYAKMKTVEAMILAMEEVTQARVIIDPAPKGSGIGVARTDPTATVVVQIAAGELDRSTAEYIAQFVAHAHAGLKPVNVNVTDANTLRSFRGASAASYGSQSRVLEYKHAVQQSVAEAIHQLLSHIVGVKVAVNAQVDLDQSKTTQTTVEEAVVGVNSERSRERDNTTERSGGEPGVRANQPMSVASGASRTSRSTEAESETRTTPVFPNRQVTTVHAPGSIKRLGAVIQVPRSFVIASWRARQGDPEAEPDEAAIDLFGTDLADAIRQQVQVLVDTRTAEDGASGEAGVVEVAVYDDPFEVASPTAMGAVGGGSGDLVKDLVGGGLLTTASLVVLAMVSVALMLMVVRNASRQDPLPSAEELVGIPPALSEADEDIVGEAGETEIAMEGAEIDEDIIRRQQILTYLNEFAGENPDEAASLLRKWMRADDI